MVETTQNTYYALYDFIRPAPTGDSRMVPNFDSLTGGNISVSSITYKVVSEGGYAVTKVIPGMTTYKPVTLLRAFDNGAIEMYEKLKKFSNLNLNVRSNFSVVMIDATGKPQAMWHLFNACPISISGFSFNKFKGENYTDFEITLQPEYIELIFF